MPDSWNRRPPSEIERLNAEEDWRFYRLFAAFVALAILLIAVALYLGSRLT